VFGWQRRRAHDKFPKSVRCGDRHPDSTYAQRGAEHRGLGDREHAAEPMSFKPGPAAQDSSHRPCLNAPSVIDHGGGHVDGKIALEEHFNPPEFSLPRCVNPMR
jgi:hypothetical protein